MAAKNNGIRHISEIFYFLTMFLYPKSFVLCPKIVLPIRVHGLAAFHIIISRYYRIHGNKCPFSLLNHSINLAYSVSCFLNVSFIHSTILDCLPAFQVIN